MHCARLESGVDKSFAERHDALPSHDWFHGLPEKQLPLAVGMVVNLHHKALEPTRKIAALGLDGVVAVVAGDVSIQVSLQDSMMIGEPLGKRCRSRIKLEVLNESELLTTHIVPSFKFNYPYFYISYLTQVKLVKWASKLRFCAWSVSHVRLRM